MRNGIGANFNSAQYDRVSKCPKDLGPSGLSNGTIRIGVNRS